MGSFFHTRLSTPGKPCLLGFCCSGGWGGMKGLFKVVDDEDGDPDPPVWKQMGREEVYC